MSLSILLVFFFYTVYGTSNNLIHLKRNTARPDHISHISRYREKGRRDKINICFLTTLKMLNASRSLSPSVLRPTLLLALVIRKLKIREIKSVAQFRELVRSGIWIHIHVSQQSGLFPHSSSRGVGLTKKTCPSVKDKDALCIIQEKKRKEKQAKKKLSHITNNYLPALSRVESSSHMDF